MTLLHVQSNFRCLWKQDKFHIQEGTINSMIIEKIMFDSYRQLTKFAYARLDFSDVVVVFQYSQSNLKRGINGYSYKSVYVQRLLS